MVECNETPISLSWFIEKYDLHGNRLDETKVDSADSAYMSDNEWTICSTSDSIAVLSYNGLRRDQNSVLYGITSKSLSGLSDSVHWKNGVVDGNLGRYYALNRNWSLNISEVRGVDIQGGASNVLAAVNGSFEHISPSLPVNGRYCVLWGDSVIGRFWFSNSVFQSRQLGPAEVHPVSVFCFGENNIAYVGRQDTVVFASWQGDSVARYDFRVPGDTGISDVTLDRAGSNLAYQADGGASNSGTVHGQDRIVLLDVATGKKMTVCQNRESQE
jgi:hypothetical protein